MGENFDMSNHEAYSAKESAIGSLNEDSYRIIQWDEFLRSMKIMYNISE
jgi:hypothetical protein